MSNIAAASTTSITNGFTLVFDAPSGQFIATAQDRNATSIAGFSIQSGNPANNEILAFNSAGQQWRYDTPFEVVDLSDGVEDGNIDYGEFE